MVKIGSRAGRFDGGAGGGVGALRRMLDGRRTGSSLMVSWPNNMQQDAALGGVDGAEGPQRERIDARTSRDGGEGMDGVAQPPDHGGHQQGGKERQPRLTEQRNI